MSLLARLRGTAFLLLVPMSVGAEPAHHVDLRWTSDARCIDQATLASTVEQALGRAVFHSSVPARATIDGTVVSVSRGFRATITLRSSGGEILARREIATEGGSCDRLDESAAIVVALMVDGVKEPEAPPPPPAPVHVPSAPHPPHGPVFEGEVGPALSFGLMPEVRGGAQVRGGAGFGQAWSLFAAAYGWLPSQAVQGSVSARIGAFAGEMGGCFAFVHATGFRLPFCVGVGAGATLADPTGVTGTGDGLQPLIFLGATLGLAFHVGGALWARVHAGAWALLRSPQYFFHTADGTTSTLFQPSFIVPIVTFGLGLRGGS